MVALCTDAELNSEVESARIVNALTAVVQFHGVHNSSWDFDGAEDALPRYVAYLDSLGAPLEKLTDGVRKWLAERGQLKNVRLFVIGQ